LLRAEITRRTDAQRNLSDATQRLEALIATANDTVVRDGVAAALTLHRGFCRSAKIGG
jgi:hypothetical protein